MNKDKKGEEIEQKWILQDKTCEALILQFQEPYKYDLTVPTFDKICRLVVVAGKILNEEAVNLEEIARQRVYFDLISPSFGKIYFSSLSKRVHNGLAGILTRKDWDIDVPLLTYLYRHEEKIAKENVFCEYDYCYRIRDREKMLNELQKYFTKKELDDFEKIGGLFKPFIKKV